MPLFDGQLDAIDLMAIEYEEQRQERQEKLNYIVRAILECEENEINLNSICDNLDIELTRAEFNWIIEKVQNIYK